MNPIDRRRLGRVAGITVTAVALVGALAFLYVRSGGGNAEGSGEVVSLLRQLRQVDAAWETEVLRSRNQFDPEAVAASPLPKVTPVQSRLAERIDGAWADTAARARLVPLVADLGATIDKKSALIERLRAQHTILRNASRELPAAGAELLDAARTKINDARTAAQLTQATEGLLADATAWLQRPDAPLRARFEERDAALTALAPRVLPDVGELIERVHQHAATVLREQKIGAELVAQSAALNTAQKIDGLADAFGDETARLRAQQQAWTEAALGFAALLVVFAAWQAWRRAHGESQLDERDAALKRAQREVREAQSALAQMEKMAALGQVAVGIAQEINTPLAAAKGTLAQLRERVARVSALARHSRAFTGMLAAKEKDAAALAHAFNEVHDLALEVAEKGTLDDLVKLLDDGTGGIDRSAEMVLSLVNFSRPDRARVSAFDVRAGLESTLLLARNLLKRVRVVKEFTAVPAIACAPAQINHVFLNLVINAAHAMPADREGFLTLRTEMDDDKTVRIEIQDNGSGIPQDVLPKIFDPSYTSKERGRGPTMGLSIAHRIVKQHGGAILVDTEVGVGTVFTILLPLEAAPAPATVLAEFNTVLAAD